MRVETEKWYMYSVTSDTFAQITSQLDEKVSRYAGGLRISHQGNSLCYSTDFLYYNSIAYPKTPKTKTTSQIHDKNIKH